MQKTFSTYIKILAKNKTPQNDPQIKYISYNSKDIKPGTLFICKGENFIPEYLQIAIDNGAVAYISEKEYKTNPQIPFLIVPNIRNILCKIAGEYYNHPQKKLKIIGITGTKGKTTTAIFTKTIFDQIGYSAACLNSIEINDGVLNIPSNLSTPEPFELFKHLNNAVTSGKEYLIMEVSSQALKYSRTNEIIFDCAAFLNIGNDHISPKEHTDFNDYYTSKLKIFQNSKQAVINTSNLTNETLKLLITATKNIPTKVIGDNNKTIQITSIIEEKTQTNFIISENNVQEIYQIKIPGKFNTSNAAVAITIAKLYNIPQQAIKSALEKTTVPGRYEEITNGTCTIIVDYAHNAISLTCLLESLRTRYKNKKIIIIFGCPGDKAQNRRQEIPQIISKYTEQGLITNTIITEDDPGYESLDFINEQIIKSLKTPHEIILDRETAIKYAIKKYGLQNIILCIGKGVETIQKRGSTSQKINSDIEVAKQTLQELKTHEKI